MTELEYALVPVAILLGYALTEALRCWARILREWEDVQGPAMYLSANFLIIILLVIHFAGLWAYRPVHFESLQGGLGLAPLFAVMVPMLIFTFAAAILMPTDRQYTKDLDSHYWKVSRPFYLTFMFAILASVLPDYLPGVMATPSIVSVLAAAAVLLVMAISRSRRVHWAMHGMAWVMFSINFGTSLLETMQVLDMMAENAAAAGD